MTTFSKDCDFSMELQASFEGSLQKDSISSAVRSVPYQTHSKKMESNKVIFHYLIRQLKTYKPLQIMGLVQLSFPPNLTHPWQVLEGDSSKAALWWIAIHHWKRESFPDQRILISDLLIHMVQSNSAKDLHL